MKSFIACMVTLLSFALAGQADAQTTQPNQNTAPGAQSTNGQLKYKAGQRVEYVEDGKWFKAIITEVRDDSANQLNGKIYAPYRIHSIGYKDLGGHWVCCADFTDRRSQLRPAGSGQTEPVPGGATGEANDEVLKGMRAATSAAPAQPGAGGAVPAKQYHCVFFLSDHLEDTPPLTITGNGTYFGGTYTFNAASSTLTFHGGDYDGQRATYDRDGTPKLHILGPSGRPVIDCD